MMPGSSLEQIAQDYLRAKGWKEADYQLEFLREEPGTAARLIVLDAVHASDLASPSRGPSRSVQLTIDLGKRKVVKELAYQ